MKIHFKISYFTQWGQRLLVSGNLPELGNGELSKSLSLQYKNGGDWVGEIDVNERSIRCCHRMDLFFSFTEFSAKVRKYILKSNRKKTKS